ncbi:MAG: zinc-finger domain-containing protein [Gammaproteobacteria bacterium]
MNAEGQSKSEQNAKNEQRVCRITRQQLPLHCPLPDMSLWNSHPRVFLPIEDTGSATCPYCGSTYTLDDD